MCTSRILGSSGQIMAPVSQQLLFLLFGKFLLVPRESRKPVTATITEYLIGAGFPAETHSCQSFLRLKCSGAATCHQQSRIDEENRHDCINCIN